MTAFRYVRCFCIAAITLGSTTLPVRTLAQSVSGPVQSLPVSTVPQPVDHPLAGVIALTVDATDIAHKLFGVREDIPVQQSGTMTLLYPRWESASHGPSVSVVSLAGLDVRADGKSVAWRRDPVDTNAFHIDVPNGARTVQVTFQIVTQPGDELLLPDSVTVPWQRLILYPAGWYARDIAISSTVTLPHGLQPSSSLSIIGERQVITRFATVSLETLLDSPVFAARYARQIALTDSGTTAVSLDLMASRTEDLAVAPERIADLRRMVAQTQAIFGIAPFVRYDILARMSNDASASGTEHRASGEISLPSTYFRDWAGQLNNRDIIPHEFVHSWNDLYRRPADQWTPTPNVPAGSSLLWVYEGQTEFWGRVIVARAGLRSVEETRDQIAIDAAEIANRPGRAWRALSDDVNYPLFMLRQPVPWRDWQRRRDYYQEGVMLWLDVDAVLRERSGGRRGLDDFARRFFAVSSADAPTSTYDFAALCQALNNTVPNEWAGFLRQWLDGHEELDTNAGLGRTGWRLVYTDVATATFAQNEIQSGVTDLSYSIGLTVADDGKVRTVTWNGPAFRAGMAPQVRILTVAGAPFTHDALLDAVRGSVSTPVHLTFEQDGQRFERTLAYRGPLRYPRLEPIRGRADRLAMLLAERQTGRSQ